MKPQTVTIDSVKVGMIFADVDYTTDEHGEEFEIGGALWEVVEVVPAEKDFNGRAHLVCVNPDDSDPEPEYFSTPFQAFVQR